MRDSPIHPVTKGRSPSLLDTVKANQLIGVVNTLCATRVTPENIVKFSFAGDMAVLDFSALEDRLQSLESRASVNLQGGNSGQVLTKFGNGDGNYGWQNPTGGNANITGGLTGQVLTKLSNSNGNYDWQDPYLGNLGSVSNHLKQLISSISSGTINATCNANSNTITVTMNFPNFPNSNF